MCVAELSRAEAEPDPTAWDAAAEHFAAFGCRSSWRYARWRQAEALIDGAATAPPRRPPLREAAAIAATLRAPLLAAEVGGLAGAPASR